jgi:hypothetical protein
MGLRACLDDAVKIKELLSFMGVELRLYSWKLVAIYTRINNATNNDISCCGF